MHVVWKSKSPAPMLGFVLSLVYLLFLAWRAWDQASVSSIILLLVWLAFVLATVAFRWRYPQRLSLEQDQLVGWMNAWPYRVPYDRVHAVQIHRFSQPTAILATTGMVQIEYRGFYGVARLSFQDANDLNDAAAELHQRFPNQVQEFRDHIKVSNKVVEQ